MTNNERSLDLGKKIIELMAAESAKQRVPAEVAIAGLVAAVTGTFLILRVKDMEHAAKTFQRDILRCATMNDKHAN